jgi:murein DD-endopeptidase MepM/ murein hydrolase activator NlpD
MRAGPGGPIRLSGVGHLGQRRVCVQPKRQPAGRYRGRRRLPKLPSARYFAVVTTAVVGAGVVALAAGAVVPDSTDRGPAGAGDPVSQAMSVDDRLSALDKANRSQDRPGPAVSVDQGAPDLWLLPLRAPYEITTLYAMRWGQFHYGVDMACPYGTPYYAAHAGTVTVARWYGGFGNGIVIDSGNGVEEIYGHASKLLVTEGQHVEAGQLLGLVGSTGYSTGNHLHYEVHVNGQPTNPLDFMLARGVDIQRHAEAASGGVVIM